MYILTDVKIMQIGQGAYGDVWLADDIQRDRLVALKKLKLGEEREGVSVYVVRKRDIAVFFQFPKNSIREISLLRMLRKSNQLFVRVKLWCVLFVF